MLVLTALCFSGARLMPLTNDCTTDSTLQFALDTFDTGDYLHTSHGQERWSIRCRTNL